MKSKSFVWMFVFLFLVANISAFVENNGYDLTGCNTNQTISEGQRFTIGRELLLTNMTTGSISTSTRVLLYYDNNCSLITTASISGKFATFNIVLPTGTYQMLVDSNGASYITGCALGTNPKNGTSGYFNWTGGINGGGCKANGTGADAYYRSVQSIGFEIVSNNIAFTSPTPSSGSFISSLSINVSITGNVTNSSRAIYIYNSTGLYNITYGSSYVNFSSLPADIYYFNASVNFTNNTKAWTETRLVYVNVGFFNFSVHNEITGAGINNFTVSFSNINTSVIDIVTTTNGSIRFMYDLNNLYSNVLTLNEGVFEPYSFNFTYSNTSNVLNLSLFPTNAGSAFLIYEGNNSNFNCSGSGVFNLTSCKLYLGDSNVLVFDFKLNKTFNYSFDLNAQTKFRLELVYPSGDIITRYYDISVVSNKSNIRLCANPINITHYEMIIYSASQRGVSLVNPFSDCIVGADYTRFAYQDAFILRTLTIDMPYFLYLVSGGTQTFLVGIDGSVESFINVDTLEFRSQAFDVVLVSDSLTVYNNKSINTSVIKYLNLDLDNSYANISIFNSSGASIFSSGALFNPNNFTVLFDYNLINTSISSLFEIRFCYTETDGDSDCDSYYLDTSSGFSGSGVSSPLAMMIAIVMVILGFTLTQSKLAFSWFGLICLFVALVILAFSPMTWYTKAFMGLIVIYIVFIAFVMPSKAKDTILG